jgi:hypothetical protein
LFSNKPQVLEERLLKSPLKYWRTDRVSGPPRLRHSSQPFLSFFPSPWKPRNVFVSWMESKKQTRRQGVYSLGCRHDLLIFITRYELGSLVFHLFLLKTDVFFLLISFHDLYIAMILIIITSVWWLESIDFSV